MPENHSLYQDRLGKLRHEIESLGLDGFILPRTDEFQGEFLAEYAQRLAWLTGFTGSAGIAAILKSKAIVLSDGRYTIQLKNEVKSAFYDVGNSTEITVGEWILEHTDAGSKIGFDPWLHTQQQIGKMEEVLKDAGVELVPVFKNPVDEIWSDQPSWPKGQVRLFPSEIAGKTFREKREHVLEVLKEKNADAFILSANDSICWLLNVRGEDVDYTPLVLSYLIVHANGDLEWFIDEGKVSGDVRKSFGASLKVRNFDALKNGLNTLDGKIVALDFSNAPVGFQTVLKSAELLDVKDPCVYPRSIKTPSECEAIRRAHIADARALHKFLQWFEEEVPKGNLCELSVAQKLEEFRAQNPAYKGASFPTICGYAENGAIIHYRSTEETNKKIVGNGLLLLDSGGQYEWGTTDITRTIAVGQPSEEMRRNYTLVLKGHIAVSMARFPLGTTGAQVDVLARSALWQEGLDYAHGTGHGVGCYLGVHEAAAHISPRSNLPIEAGMLLSNEPGYYKEGAYGIRIENLVLAQKAGVCADTGKEMLSFETMTYVQYDECLIIVEMLSMAERQWLNAYNNIVLKTLSGE